MELHELDTLPILSQKNLAFRELGKEHWECYIVTQIENCAFHLVSFLLSLIALEKHLGNVIIHFNYILKNNNNDNIIINFR